MNTTSATTTHTPSPVVAYPANINGRGNLAYFASTCSCGMELASTMRSSVDLDVRQHVEYFASGRAARDARLLARTGARAGRYVR